MTKQYRVELTGESREVYVVEADSEEDARANWMHGWLAVQECYGMEVYRVDLDSEGDADDHE